MYGSQGHWVSGVSWGVGVSWGIGCDSSVGGVRGPARGVEGIGSQWGCRGIRGWQGDCRGGRGIVGV